MRSPENELLHLKEEGLLRQLRAVHESQPPHTRIDAKAFLNFSSNDYLGLSQHPALIEAATRATRDFGTGSTSSRLICGSLSPHHTLEEMLAKLKKTEAALTFANGYAVALGVLPALAGKGDTLIIDKLAHASLIDGARLAQQNGATLRVFPHNNLLKLEKLLTSTRVNSAKDARIIVITESVFSMDGDTCPLPEIVALKDQHDALLLLDEAHAVGVLGPTGQGLAEHYGLQSRVDLQMGTLGKALGSAGGYLAASRPFIELIINKARSFIYSTAPPASQSAASLAALQLLQSPQGQALRQKLLQNIATFQQQLLTFAPPFLPSPFPTPIIPVIIGENEATLQLSQKLSEQGILAPAIRYPTVPQGTARLRLTLSASHCVEHLTKLASALKSGLATAPKKR